MVKLSAWNVHTDGHGMITQIGIECSQRSAMVREMTSLNFGSKSTSLELWFPLSLRQDTQLSKRGCTPLRVV